MLKATDMSTERSAGKVWKTVLQISQGSLCPDLVQAHLLPDTNNNVNSFTNFINMQCFLNNLTSLLSQLCPYLYFYGWIKKRQDRINWITITNCQCFDGVNGAKCQTESYSLHHQIIDNKVYR